MKLLRILLPGKRAGRKAPKRKKKPLYMILLGFFSIKLMDALNGKWNKELWSPNH